MFRTKHVLCSLWNYVYFAQSVFEKMHYKVCGAFTWSTSRLTSQLVLRVCSLQNSVCSFKSLLWGIYFKTRSQRTLIPLPNGQKISVCLLHMCFWLERFVKCMGIMTWYDEQQKVKRRSITVSWHHQYNKVNCAKKSPAPCDNAKAIT